MCLWLGVRTGLCQTLGSWFLLSSGSISHHVLSTFFCPSQAHGSGGFEELHFLAESEPRRHCVCRAGLRYVQSSSQTAVTGRCQMPSASSLWLWPFPSYLDETVKAWLTPLAMPFTCATQRKCCGKPFNIHYSKCVGSFMWKRGQF